MAQNETTYKPAPFSMPSEVKNLPVFKLFGDQLPAMIDSNAKEDKKTDSTEKSKKIAPKLVFFSLIGLGAYLIIHNADAITSFFTSMFEIAAAAIMLGVASIAIIVLYLLYPKIIKFLYNSGKIFLFKQEKKLVQNNPLENLEILAEESKTALDEVRDKITDVDSNRRAVIMKAEAKDKEAIEKFNKIGLINNKVTTLRKKSDTLKAEGNIERANQIEREIKEHRTQATLSKLESESARQNAQFLAQCGNELAKVLEILRDNETGVKIFVATLRSTVDQIKDKIQTTSDINKATKNIADIYGIKDSWKFNIAMDAANKLIANNLSSIRSNLQFVRENQSVITGTMSEEELNDFTKRLKDGGMKSLNIEQLSSAEYELKPEERIDKSLSFL